MRTGAIMRGMETVFRCLYGLFFLAVGVYGAQAYLRGLPSPFQETNPEGAAFQAALVDTGFIMPIMQLCYIVGGAFLLVRRTVPMGAIVLGPFVLVIFFYHLMLTGRIVWGSIWLIGLLIFMTTHRAAFLGLVNFKESK